MITLAKAICADILMLLSCPVLILLTLLALLLVGVVALLEYTANQIARAFTNGMREGFSDKTNLPQEGEKK